MCTPIVKLLNRGTTRNFAHRRLLIPLLFMVYVLLYSSAAFADSGKALSIEAPEMQSFVNTGFEEAAGGFVGLLLLAWRIDNDRKRRKRYNYLESWDLDYQPEHTLAIEIEEMDVENGTRKREPEARSRYQGWTRRRGAFASICVLTILYGSYKGAFTYAEARLMDNGKMKIALTDYSGAERDFRNALILNPSNVGARALVGDVLMRQHRYNAAITELAFASKMDHSNAGTLVMLGDCLQIVHREMDAEEEYRAAILASPARTEAYIKLSKCLEDLRRIDESIRALRKAAKLDPKNVKVHADLGRLLLTIGFADEGMDHLEYAAALEPGNLVGLRALADGYVSIGRYADAADELRAALAIDPESAEDYFNLGYVLKRVNDLKGASTAYKNYVALTTHNYTPAKSELQMNRHAMLRADPDKHDANLSTVDAGTPTDGLRIANEQLKAIRRAN